MTRVTLYTKADCHLCDLALTLLNQFDLTISIVDIQSQAALIEKYSLIIPVVVFENGVTLNWPFDAMDIQSQLTTK
jgi:glutaredoxin